MVRHYYYVCDVGSEWEVRPGLDPIAAARRFNSQAAAIAAAAKFAREEWKLLGRPTGVRVPDLNGQWRDEITFGDETLLRASVASGAGEQRHLSQGHDLPRGKEPH